METPINISETRTMNITVLSAGVSDPSSTRLLANQASTKVRELLEEQNNNVNIEVIELRGLAAEITAGITTGLISEKLSKVFDTISASDGIIVSTPVYKAGVSGLLKSFVDLWENDLVIAKPVMLLATAGTPRHALVVDEQMRSLFAYLRALIVPTSVFAASDDWNTTDLTARIVRAAQEFAVLVEQDIAGKLLAKSWNHYRRDFDSRAQQAAGQDSTLNLDPELMKLATGGSL